MNDFFNVLLEANDKKPKTTTIKPDKDDQTTDYNAEIEESDPSKDGADVGDGTDDTTSDDTTTDDTTDTNEDTESEDEMKNKRLLLDDFINLYQSIKATIIKIDSIDNKNILSAKNVLGQISKNFDNLLKQIFEYISFNYSKNKYVYNLYKYNQFIEALRINIKMLKKISDFLSNS